MVGNVIPLVLASKSFETFFFEKIKYGSWFFHNLQIKYNLKLLCYYMVNNLPSLHTIDKYYAHKHSITN